MSPCADLVRRAAGAFPHGPGEARRILGVEQAVRRLLLAGVMPLWLGAGLADWYLHRRTHIERTSGPRESAIHSLMFAETGVPVLLGLFCEVNATVLLSAFAAVGAHSVTAYWDQAYAEDRRRVSTVEQHVHSLLEVSPLTAAFLLTALHWDQALAAVGRGRPRFGLRLKHRGPLPVSARVWLLTAVAAFGVVPYAETLRYRMHTNKLCRDGTTPAPQFRSSLRPSLLESPQL